MHVTSHHANGRILVPARIDDEEWASTRRLFLSPEMRVMVLIRGDHPAGWLEIHGYVDRWVGAVAEKQLIRYG